MPKVRFLSTVTTKEAQPQTFEAGKVYDLREDSVERWIRRGVAESVVDEAKDQAKPKANGKPKEES